MEIDWFTLIAQIVNFVVLVFLLKVFLYDRILGAIDTREEDIAARIEDTEQAKREAETVKTQLEQEREDISRRRSEIIENAREDAAQKRERMIDEAREEVDEIRARWVAGLQQQKEAFVARFRRAAGDELLETARKVLEDLSDDDLEESIVRAFVHRLEHLSGNERENLERFVEQAEERVIIQSAFELSPEMKKRLAEALSEVSERRITGDRIAFELTSEALGGVELSAGGNRIGWTIESYLSSLERFVSEAFDRESGA
jgi:F-type H+-transporting ATPase subunit b